MGWNGREQGKESSGLHQHGRLCPPGGPPDISVFPVSGLHLLNCRVLHMQLQHHKAPSEVFQQLHQSYQSQMEVPNGISDLPDHEAMLAVAKQHLVKQLLD